MIGIAGAMSVVEKAGLCLEPYREMEGCSVRVHSLREDLDIKHLARLVPAFGQSTDRRINATVPDDAA